jgi:hypothetical protein
VLRFVTVTAAMSLALGVPLLLLGWRTSSLLVQSVVGSVLAMVPFWSMIVAAAGASWRRKAVYIGGSMAFVFVFDLVTILTGWQQIATSTEIVVSVRDGVLTSAYRLIALSAPFVTIVLFAGKRPSLFWTSER